MPRLIESIIGPVLPSQDQRGNLRSIKMVSCVIRPEKLDEVKDALNKLNLVGGMTVTDVRGFGRQKGSAEHYRGGTYTIRFKDKVKIDLAIQNEDLDQVLKVVASTAHTGQVGDGKVFVFDVNNAMRVRTGEKGYDAL